MENLWDYKYAQMEGKMYWLNNDSSSRVLPISFCWREHSGMEEPTFRNTEGKKKGNGWLQKNPFVL